MKMYQQFLASIENQPIDSQPTNPQQMNELASKMIKELVSSIKKNRSTRIDGDLVFEAVPSHYVLPKSIDEEKAKTKWEKFAEEKGIKKKSKSRMVFSEKLDKWVPRYGSRSEQNQILQGGVVEVEQSMSKMVKEKKKRASENRKN